MRNNAKVEPVVSGRDFALDCTLKKGTNIATDLHRTILPPPPLQKQISFEFMGFFPVDWYLPKGPFTRCDNANFFFTQAMDSMESNESVHTRTYVSSFYCDIDLNGQVIFDAVTDALCEWT